MNMAINSAKKVPKSRQSDVVSNFELIMSVPTKLYTCKAQIHTVVVCATAVILHIAVQELDTEYPASVLAPHVLDVPDR
ncbi:hypothetical protein AAMO2058_000318600 [Amorphochlora amoebiformis]